MEEDCHSVPHVFLRHHLLEAQSLRVTAPASEPVQTTANAIITRRLLQVVTV